MRLRNNIVCRWVNSLCCVVVLFLSACTNPFAPKLSNGELSQSLLGNQKTVEGFFKNFKYAYQFKDTLVFGKLLADDFTFIFRDYNLGIDKTWGRSEEMLSTWGLFQGTNSADLNWNEAVQTIGDSLVLDISRSFSLNIEFNPNDIVRIYGRANLRLKRNSSDQEWRMQSWRDESNY